VSEMQVIGYNPPSDFVHTMIGTKLAHYEIILHIGSGGDVY